MSSTLRCAPTRSETCHHDGDGLAKAIIQRRCCCLAEAVQRSKPQPVGQLVIAELVRLVPVMLHVCF
jgi:hypothetical protein